MEGYFGTILKKIREKEKEAIEGRKSFDRRKQRFILTIALPKSKKCKVVRKMARLLMKDFFDGKKGVSNFLLAKCLGIKFDLPNPNLVNEEYKASKLKYDGWIGNRFRTLKKHWLPIRYSVKFSKDSSRLIKLP